MEFAWVWGAFNSLSRMLCGIQDAVSKGLVMQLPVRLFIPILGLSALCAKPAKALQLFAQTAQVDVSTCIGECILGPLLPLPTDIAGTTSDLDSTLALASRSDDNGVAADLATGQGESDYGGTLRVFARAESNEPLDSSVSSLSDGPLNSGASSLALWFGEFAVAGDGPVLLDMALSADAQMFVGAGSSGRAELGVQMGVMTVADFEDAVAAGGLFNPAIFDFVAGNAFAATTVIDANGVDDPQLSVEGVDASNVVLDGRS